MKTYHQEKAAQTVHQARGPMSVDGRGNVSQELTPALYARTCVWEKKGLSPLSPCPRRCSVRPLFPDSKNRLWQFIGIVRKTPDKLYIRHSMPVSIKTIGHALCRKGIWIICPCVNVPIYWFAAMCNLPMRQCANRVALYTVGDWPLVHYHHLSNSR